MGDPNEIEAPFCADVFKGQIAAIAERDIWNVKTRIVQQLAGDVGDARSESGNAIFGVGVLSIEGVPVGDENVLVAIEVHIEEYDAPRPFRSGDAAQLGDFRKGVVAAIEEECVALDLRAIVDFADVVEVLAR